MRFLSADLKTMIKDIIQRKFESFTQILWNLQDEITELLPTNRSLLEILETLDKPEEHQWVMRTTVLTKILPFLFSDILILTTPEEELDTLTKNYTLFMRSAWKSFITSKSNVIDNLHGLRAVTFELPGDQQFKSVFSSHLDKISY